MTDDTNKVHYYFRLRFSVPGSGRESMFLM